jgi:spore coat polysaccharide biosynthesis predicted glycosyltransferase SpsG/CMP-N-acetylneuraminic acid synthetase
MHRILIVIPARGGSVGIPRKPIVPLCGQPLIAYSIRTAQRAQELWKKGTLEICVSSNDHEILAVARGLGARGLERPQDLARPETPLDPVVHHALQVMDAEGGPPITAVITQQPTTPLFSAETFVGALRKFLANQSTLETLCTVSEERFLHWEVDPTTGGFKPGYAARVNRQQLPPIFKETGSFVMCPADWLRKSGTRFGPRVDVYPVTGPEAIDIDTPEDFALCQHFLSRKRIVFAVVGHREVGLGHVARSLILANALVEHEKRFLFDAKSTLGLELVKKVNHKVHQLQPKQDWVSGLLELKPDLVINDRLDTTAEEIQALQAAGVRVINFEDLGSGALHADVVVNDLYTHAQSATVKEHHIYSGPQYFCARPEFESCPKKVVPPSPQKILITFGGTDPNNLTRKVLETLLAAKVAAEINVVLGLGYPAELETAIQADYPHIRFQRNIANMAECIHQADVVFTSAGRTVYEIACIGTPAIVLAQNEREMTHHWAAEENGFLHLGLGSAASPESILAAYRRLNEDSALYAELSRRMKAANLHSGTQRVLRLVHQAFYQD